jgi:hypothetical protein
MFLDSKREDKRFWTEWYFLRLVMENASWALMSIINGHIAPKELRLWNSQF